MKCIYVYVEHHSDDIFFFIFIFRLVEFDLLVVEAEKTFVTLSFINLTAVERQNLTTALHHSVDTFITSYKYLYIYELIEVNLMNLLSLTL